jgi:hypothetical protein
VPEIALNGSRLDPLLEVRLMYEWTAYASKTVGTAVDFWSLQTPLIALEFRHTLDAVFAISALHASRQPRLRWTPGKLDGHMSPIDDATAQIIFPDYIPGHAQNFNGIYQGRDPGTQHPSLSAGRPPLSNAGNNVYLAAKRGDNMLAISRVYFERAIEGHTRALQNLTLENIEAAYITSALTTMHSVFVLSEVDHDSTMPSVEPVQWVRLARALNFITQRWAELVSYIVESSRTTSNHWQVGPSCKFKAMD